MIFEFRYLDVDLPEEWEVSVLPAELIDPRFLDIPSTSSSSAKEIEAKPTHKALTYNYETAQAWYTTSAQIISASGWRPGCTIAHRINVLRILPPEHTTSPIIINSVEGMRHLASVPGVSKDDQSAYGKSRLAIFAGPFFRCVRHTTRRYAFHPQLGNGCRPPSHWTPRRHN